jgi:8-oxo-dGTP pyrophosphatase MutT (NUDIX family)
MPDLDTLLPAEGDAYHGIKIDPAALPVADPAAFAARLDASLAHWRADGRKGVWLKVPLPAGAALVPAAIAAGFTAHHAEPAHLMLTTWLAPGPSRLPAAASHQVGVGALVVAPRGPAGATYADPSLAATPHILVVQEAAGPLKGTGVWKMPTGLADAGEDVVDAAVREVAEETGVAAVPVSLLALRQAHGFSFGASDAFFVIGLRTATPDEVDKPVRPVDGEVEAVRWMPVSEYEALPFFKGRPLWAAVSARCAAHARGEYVGMRLDKLENGFNGRQDLVAMGDL